MLENSVIVSYIMVLCQRLKVLLRESLIVDWIGAGTAWLESLLKASRLLSWFSSDWNVSQWYEKSLICQGTRHIHNKMAHLFERFVKPLLEGSIFFRVISMVNIHWVLGFIMVTGMVLMPTNLAMIIGALVILSYWYMGFISQRLVNRSSVFALTAAYLVFVVLGMVTGFKGAMALQIGLINLTYIGAGLTLGQGMKEKRHLHWLLYGMLFMTALTCLYGLYQYVIGVEVDPAWVDTDLFEDLRTRVYSVFGNPNVFGLYLVMMAPIALALAFGLKNWLMKLIFLGTFAIAVLNIGLTLSRGSMIGIAIALALMLVFIDRRFLFIGLLALPFLPLMLPQSIIERLMSIGNMQESSSAYRVSIYMASINMVRDFFFGGLGLGGFNKIYFAYAFSASKAYHAHNTFLMVLLEYGIVGFIIFIALLFLWFKEVMGAAMVAKKPLDKYILLAFAGGIVGSSVQGLVEHIWHNSDIMFFYWLLILLGAGYARLVRKEALND